MCMPVLICKTNKDTGADRIKSIINCVFLNILYILCLFSVNISFHINETTWIGAVAYCQSIGAVIYSDEKDIRSRTEYEVWTGKYKSLTPWVITWGNYEYNLKKK